MKYREYRWAAQGKLRLEHENWALFVTLKDVSRTGMRIRGMEIPAAGTRVRLTLVGLPVSGHIVWLRNGHGGVAFDRSLTASQLLALRGLRHSKRSKNKSSPQKRAAFSAQSYEKF
ncbi:MAG: PilZ domain-containing protein [Rhodobacteraceae bacterium]|nr:PilZ domain-containing protein [Paracoccaceae bacterium]